MSFLALGILGGVLLSLFFSFGPAFFSQVQASIHYGFRNAVPFAFGVSTSDVVVVAVLLLISHNTPMEEMIALLNNRWLIYVGAAVVGSFGFYTMFLKTRLVAVTAENGVRKYDTKGFPSRISVYLRGLSLNLFNPVIWLYWATLVAILICGDTAISVSESILFFVGVLTATLSLDVLKCKLASLLQLMITHRFLKIFNKTIGAILIAFAVFMVVSTTSRFEDKSGNKRSIEMMQEIMSNKTPSSVLHNN